MRIVIKKRKLKYTLIFILFILLITLVIFFFSPVYEWNYKGYMFEFRDNLKDADKVFVEPSCQTIYDTFNNIYVRNITIYFKNDEEDFGYFQLEVIELSYKLTLYYKINKKNIFVDAAKWNLEEQPLGSPLHPRFYLIGPSSADRNSVELKNFTVIISGRNLQELDRATVKTMMCIFGIKI